MMKIMIKEKQIKMYLLIPLIIGILIPFYTYQADYKFPVEYGYMCILISFYNSSFYRISHKGTKEF